MKAYKVELLIFDFGEIGDNITSVIENQKFPNHCISPKVMKIQSVDIGDFMNDDDHPLTNENTQKVAFDAYFQQT